MSKEKVGNLIIKPKKYWGLVDLYESDIERTGSNTGGMFAHTQINYHGNANY